MATKESPKEKHTYQGIHILGASGSGTTTLAQALSQTSELSEYTVFDSDDFFWEIKHSKIRPLEERLHMLRTRLDEAESWILSGAVIDWGNPLIPVFDLIIFLSIPNEIRIERLKKREQERYGDQIFPGGSRHKEYNDFIEWAQKYETGGLEVRSRKQQEEWMSKLGCPVLRIEGDSSVEENVRVVIDYFKEKDL